MGPVDLHLHLLHITMKAFICSNSPVLGDLTDDSMRQDGRVGHSMGDHRVSNGVSYGSKSTGHGVGNSYRTSNSMSNRVSHSTNNIRVGGSSLIGHLSNVASDVVGSVVDMLDPSVREVDRVRARNSSGSVISLRLGEVRTRVVIRHGILVVVGRGLSQVRSSIASNSMSHRMGTNQRSGMSHHRSMSNSYRGVGNNSVTNKSVASKSVTNKSVSANMTT